MTEAIRNGQSNGIQTVSGELVNAPLILTQAIDVTPGAAPRPSGSGNLSRDMMGGPTLGEKAAALVLAVGMLGGAKLVFDSQSAKGQSPSPTPIVSLNPDGSVLPTDVPLVGQADPTCPPGMIPRNPEPSPSPSPSLKPTPAIGEVIPGNGVLFAFKNSQGQTLEVSIFGQEAPSAEPEKSFLPMEGFDVNGDGVVDERDDMNGDGVIDEKDTQTAALDCVPDPNLEMPTLDKKLDAIFNQKDNEILNPTVEEIKTEVNDIWKKYGKYLQTYIDPAYYDGEMLKKKRLIDRINKMSELKDRHEREAVVAGTIALFLSIDEKISRDPSMQAIRGEMGIDLRNIPDMVFDYAISNIPIEKSELKANLEFDVKDILTFYLMQYGMES